MKKDLCELVVILDESGSMGLITNDTIGGFNTFLETHQKLPGDANLTLVKFDTKYEIVHNGVDVRSVKPLDKTTYSPGGATALLDAVGRAIDELGKRYDVLSEDEKPGKVIFLIITDGEENSSREYKLKQIKEKTTKRQNDDKWEFVFMGANQDAWAEAGKMGYSKAVNYSVQDMGRTMKAAAYYTSNSRMYSEKTSLKNFDLSDAELDQELKNAENAGNTGTPPIDDKK